MDKQEKQETASFKKISESLRHVAPHDFQCQMFCRGRKCKYEGSAHWAEHQMALNGIFSHWITCNILAMARPNTEQIYKYKLIDQFHSNGIRTIINLQQAGEHAYCGTGLESGGFSYISALFMENGIFFYNFPWRDYGVAPLESIADVMKVIAFSLVQGKVAIHCHAGLGVVIACYLVYAARIMGNTAIHYVRQKRANSIQTRIQIATVKAFHRFISPSFVVINVGDYDDDDEFTLDEHLKRQSRLLHGFEARIYKYLPKFVHQVCERLLQLAGLEPVVTITDPTRSESSKHIFWKKFLGMKELKSSATSSPILTPSESGHSSKFSFGFDVKSMDGRSIKERVNKKLQPLSKSRKSSTDSFAQVKSPSLVKKLKKAFKIKKKHEIIDEEDNLSFEGTSGQSSKPDSNGSIESYIIDVSSLEEEDNDETENNVESSPKLGKSGKKHFPSSTSLSTRNLIEVDDDFDDEPLTTWSRWKKKLLVDEEEFEDTRSNEDSDMERMVSQQSSLVLSDEAAEESVVVDSEYIYHSTLPPQVIIPVPPEQLLTANQLAEALTTNPEKLPQETLQKIDELARTVNDDIPNGWNTLVSTTDPMLLIGLFYIWLEQLQQPLLSRQDWTQIRNIDYINDPVNALQMLSRNSRITLEYLLRFVVHIEPISMKQKQLIIKSLIITLMQQHIVSAPSPITSTIEEASNFALAVIKLIDDSKETS